MLKTIKSLYQKFKTEKKLFRVIKKREVSQMFQLILDRIKWMDKNNIKQWNVINYTEIYTRDYYEKKRKKGELFVLLDEGTNEIICAAVLQDSDKIWNDGENALYIHNFVSKIGKSGAGGDFLKYAIDYAKLKGKKYFRLDCAANNDKLNGYYEKHGFIRTGICEDGLYRGILREKKL